MWPYADYGAGYCSNEEKEHLLKLTQENERPFVDYIFLMMVPPEVSLKRRVKPQTSIDFYILTSYYLPILYGTYNKVKELHFPKHTIEIDGMKSVGNTYKEIKSYLFSN